MTETVPGKPGKILLARLSSHPIKNYDAGQVRMNQYRTKKINIA
jgi:hypothetical protein